MYAYRLLDPAGGHTPHLVLEALGDIGGRESGEGRPDSRPSAPGEGGQTRDTGTAERHGEDVVVMEDSSIASFKRVPRASFPREGRANPIGFPEVVT
jgi:hypothetical protein